MIRRHEPLNYKASTGARKPAIESAEVRFLQAKLKIVSTEMERQQSEYRRKVSKYWNLKHEQET